MTNPQKKVLEALATGISLSEALTVAGKDLDWHEKQGETYKSAVDTILGATDTDTQPLDEAEAPTEIEAPAEVEQDLEDRETLEAELRQHVNMLWRGASHDFARELKWCIPRTPNAPTTFLKAHYAKCKNVNHISAQVREAMATFEKLNA